MSLQVWLPLNGNLENKGIASISTTNTPIYVDGKMGKAINLTSRVKFYNLPKLTKFTITFWAKVESCTADWADLLGFTCKQADDSNAATFRFEATTSSRACSFHNNAPEGISTGSRILIRNYNEWHHVAVSYNGEKLYSYIDGSLTYTDTGLGGYLTSSFHIGESPITGAMNDLRIYDECLSKEQIHQISQGLVLHYPLNSGYGNENLMKMGGLDKNGATSMTYNSSTDTYTIVSPAGTNSWGYGVSIRSTSEISIPYGKSYRASVEVYVPTQHSFVADINNNVANGTTAWAGNDNDNTSKRTSTSFTIPANTWKKISWGSENSNGNNTDKVAILPYDKLGLRTNSDTDSVTWYLRHPKIEIGTSVTDWCPNKNDALYKTLGYDTTTEYDTSGFGNNGQKKNNPVYTTDSPIGNSCIQLQRANSQYIQLPEMTLPDTLTINFWAKVNSFAGWQRFFEFADALQGANGNYRFLFGTFSNTKQLGLHIYGGSDGTTSWFVNSNIGEIDTNWHSYSISINKTILNIFYDGKNILNKTITDNFPIHKRQYMYIGKSSYSADAYFDGEISDFRIYATALTADDIKQLYQTKAKIDKNGNLYCNQFIDNDYEEELLTTQKMTFHQATSQGTITYETNGNEVINIITMDNTISSWKYLFNNAFDKTKIINHKLKLSFKYKTNVSTAYSMAVKMCKGDSTKPQTINIGSITLSTNWQEYNGIITFGNTYDNQGIYIHTGNFCGGNLYIKDLSLKIYENNNKTDFTKKSQIITGELSELDSNKTYVYKNSKIVTNQIIEN